MGIEIARESSARSVRAPPLRFLLIAERLSKDAAISPFAIAGGSFAFAAKFGIFFRSVRRLSSIGRARLS